MKIYSETANKELKNILNKALLIALVPEDVPAPSKGYFEGPGYITIAYGDEKMFKAITKMDFYRFCYVRFTSYGKDAKNEGVRVKPSKFSSTHPLYIAQEINGYQPFLTIGVAKGGSAFDTRNLTFRVFEDGHKGWKKRINNGDTMWKPEKITHKAVRCGIYLVMRNGQRIPLEELTEKIKNLPEEIAAYKAEEARKAEEERKQREEVEAKRQLEKDRIKSGMVLISNGDFEKIEVTESSDDCYETKTTIMPKEKMADVIGRYEAFCNDLEAYEFYRPCLEINALTKYGPIKIFEKNFYWSTHEDDDEYEYEDEEEEENN